jgi:hypothetical protein
MIIPFVLYFVTFYGSLSENDQNWANFGSFIGGIVSSIFAYASFVILISNFIFDRDKVNKERCIEYLKYVNILNSKINKIIMDIENIRQYSKHILGEKKYNELSIITDNDFMKICSRINVLKGFLIDNIEFFKRDVTNLMYYNIIIEKIDHVVNPDLLINAFTEFENNACNYYYMIDRNIRNEYKLIIKTFANISSNKMENFNIFDFKKTLVQHIFSINESILENKLDRSKDWFDN